MQYFLFTIILFFLTTNQLHSADNAEQAAEARRAWCAEERRKIAERNHPGRFSKYKEPPPPAKQADVAGQEAAEREAAKREASGVAPDVSHAVRPAAAQQTATRPAVQTAAQPNKVRANNATTQLRYLAQFKYQLDEADGRIARLGKERDTAKDQRNAANKTIANQDTELKKVKTENASHLDTIALLKNQAGGGHRSTLRLPAQFKDQADKNLETISRLGQERDEAIGIADKAQKAYRSAFRIQANGLMKAHEERDEAREERDAAKGQRVIAETKKKAAEDQEDAAKKTIEKLEMKYEIAQNIALFGMADRLLASSIKGILPDGTERFISKDLFASTASTATATAALGISRIYQNRPARSRNGGTQMIANTVINAGLHYLGMQIVSGAVSTINFVKKDSIDVETNSANILNIQKITGILLAATLGTMINNKINSKCLPLSDS